MCSAKVVAVDKKESDEEDESFERVGECEFSPLLWRRSLQFMWTNHFSLASAETGSNRFNSNLYFYFRPSWNDRSRRWQCWSLLPSIFSIISDKFMVILHNRRSSCWWLLWKSQNFITLNLWRRWSAEEDQRMWGLHLFENVYYYCFIRNFVCSLVSIAGVRDQSFGASPRLFLCENLLPENKSPLFRIKNNKLYLTETRRRVRHSSRRVRCLHCCQSSRNSRHSINLHSTSGDIPRVGVSAGGIIGAFLGPWTIHDNAILTQ